MSLLLYSDFQTGKYKLALNNYTEDDITAYITKYEKRYLQDLMGVELYNLFIASLSSGLPTGIYLTLYNSFAEDNPNSGFIFSSLSGEYLGPSVEGGSTYPKIIRSEGIKEMLKGFIFWEYSRDLPVKSTMVGDVEENNENSTLLKGKRAGRNEKFNEAVKTYQAIQWYISDNPTVYPTYNGASLDILGMY